MMLTTEHTTQSTERGNALLAIVVCPFGGYQAITSSRKPANLDWSWAP